MIEFFKFFFEGFFFFLIEIVLENKVLGTEFTIKTRIKMTLKYYQQYHFTLIVHKSDLIFMH